MVILYSNVLNNFSFGFTATQLDIFYCIIGCLGEDGTCEIDFHNLRKYIKCRNYTKSEFVRELDFVNEKLIKTNFLQKEDNFIIRFTLFDSLAIYPEDELLVAIVNKRAMPMVCHIRDNFTKIELEELVSIQGKYAKRLYLLLKQYRHTGAYMVRLDDLRTRLGITPSYNPRDINSKIIDPSLTQIQKYFPGLSVECKYDKNRQGHPLSGYYFKFEKEEKQPDKKLVAGYYFKS